MPRWTPEARESQRRRIKQWKPWQQSTGPRTQYGKRVSSRNREGKGSCEQDPRHVSIAAAQALIQLANLQFKLDGFLSKESQEDLLLARRMLEVAPPPPSNRTNQKLSQA
ncbi:MAG: hypothetical protein RM368_32955 [Nostoc sp. DedSLP03]|uniref:hypothetical protein n=1 Tax=Nostoc sp. DedSLP03 TaxID=3075400 RepID=UPI002AD24D14|nr:hypothetical protein [Nostoc sp. DedSLP03]MDZ7969700.1 hypothetical protein [Nostoc sp. DedSLP03]